MDKNSIIGIILMGLVLFGFTFYENKQYQKRAAYQAQLDSIAYVEQLKADSIAAANAAVIDSARQKAPCTRCRMTRWKSPLPRKAVSRIQ